MIIYKRMVEKFVVNNNSNKKENNLLYVYFIDM